MIKKLLLITALLAPCLAYGQDTIPLDPIRASPVRRSDPGVVSSGDAAIRDADDHAHSRKRRNTHSLELRAVRHRDIGSRNQRAGGRIVGPVIPAAAAAGFTTAAVNVDFSQVASNWISTNVDGCGGPTTGLRWTWRAMGNNSIQAPCSRLNLETDSSVGKQVLHIQTTPADTAVGALGLSWPGVPFGGDASNMLPIQGYTQITFRTTASSMNQTIAPKGYSIIGIYLPNGPNRSPTWFEADGLEALPQTNTGNGWTYGDSGLEWNGGRIIGGMCCATPDANGLKADLTVYHTIGWLFTSDGTQISKCYYLDGHALLNSCAKDTGLSNPSYELSEHDLIWAMGIADGGGGTTNNVDVYVQSIRIWECPTWYSGPSPCFGTIITH